MLDTSLYAERIARLQEQMAGQGYAAVVVPRSDEHQGEWVAESSERLRWLTGFGGSAGRAVVTVRAAALFLDGRYASEAKSSLASPALEVRHMQEEPLSAWLAVQTQANGIAPPAASTSVTGASLAGSMGADSAGSDSTDTGLPLLGYDPVAHHAHSSAGFVAFGGKVWLAGESDGGKSDRPAMAGQAQPAEWFG